MQRVLMIDNEGDDLWPTSVLELFNQNGFEAHSLVALREKFPSDLSGYDCIFLGGSVFSSYNDFDWIHREHEFIRRAAQQKIPMLGLCFGSQILAYALCGADQVFRRAQCDVGYFQVDLDVATGDPLLRGLPGQVPMLIWHSDEVRADHPDMVILGSTPACPNQIWRYRDLPVWGIQGHPELSREQIIRVLENYHDHFVRDGADNDAIVRQADDTHMSKKFVQNFIDYCMSR